MAKQRRKHNRNQLARREAKDAGNATYFTGYPCIKGHLSPRRTNNAQCIECSMWYTKNADPIREKDRLKEWRARNSEKRKTQNQRGWLKNGAKKREAARKYKRDNPDIVKACVQRRRARTKGATGDVKPSEFKSILVKQKFKCAWCGGPIKKTAQLDHVKPLSLGGEHHPRNIVAACGDCNRRKSAKDPVAWAREIGLLI